jgi:hypothetical protein
MRVSGWVLLLAIGAVAGGAVGQRVDGDAAALPAASVAGELRNLASRAGVIFVGQVQRIVPKDGVVEITFRVEQPVLGVVGSSYVEREWAGRWAGGQQRYWVGQRAMFFLYAPSAAGLSSSVDGMAGVVPLVPMGPMGPKADPLLDVRMLGTRVQRLVGAPMGKERLGAISLGDGKSVVRSWKGVKQTEPVRRALPVTTQMPMGESLVGTQGGSDVPR